jgi:hypothetical protein
MPAGQQKRSCLAGLRRLIKAAVACRTFSDGGKPAPPGFVESSMERLASTFHSPGVGQGKGAKDEWAVVAHFHVSGLQLLSNRRRDACFSRDELFIFRFIINGRRSPSTKLPHIRHGTRPLELTSPRLSHKNVSAQREARGSVGVHLQAIRCSGAATRSEPGIAPRHYNGHPTWT